MDVWWFINDGNVMSVVLIGCGDEAPLGGAEGRTLWGSGGRQEVQLQRRLRMHQGVLPTAARAASAAGPRKHIPALLEGSVKVLLDA